MDIAALILWILTAGGGFVLLGTWLSKGGARRDGTGSTFPPALIFGHFLLAAAGLLLWIVYVATKTDGIGWIAFAALALVALLGFAMFARWIPVYRGAATARAGAHGASSSGASSSGAPNAATAPAGTSTLVAEPAERHFPVPIVAGHGLLAAATLVLVLLTMLGVGN